MVRGAMVGDASAPHAASLARVVALGGDRRYAMFECIELDEAGALLEAKLAFDPGERLELELEFEDGTVVTSAAVVEAVSIEDRPRVRVSFAEAERAELVDALKRARGS